ncbi:MAG: hypothetical protein O3A95_11000 [Planctomycetota bacterium]|nr:hypothetical protein [Planctomycetota bacterium]
MKKTLTLFALLAVASLASCTAGPKQLARSVDDWDREMYVETPLMNGALHVIPVIPIVDFVATIGDILIVNPWFFWSEDVWDAKGTNFEHTSVWDSDGHLDSLAEKPNSGFMKKN